MSEGDFRTLEMYRPMMDVQYFLSVVHHNLGQQAECEDAAKRHFATQEMRREIEVSDGDVLGILEVLRTVGSALAARST
jgi:anaphase-promoting complex subunit 5